MPDEVERGAIRKFLFECIKGANEEDNRAWKKLWKKITNLEVGEITFVDFVFPRNYKFHKRFFAMLDVGYDAWEPPRKRRTYKKREITKNREQFREEIIILAGFYEQTFNLKGEMRLRAKSISFAKMEQPEFEQLYSAVVDVLLREVLHTYKDRDELDEVVERVLGFA